MRRSGTARGGRRRSRPDRAADRHAVDRLRGDPPRRAVADGVLAGRARRRADAARPSSTRCRCRRRRRRWCPACRTCTRPPAAGAAPRCGLVVKQRDGRPIKIEGNDASPLTGGGTCAAGQASVLSLYDDARLRGPVWLGNPVSWPEIDRHIRTVLDRAGPRCARRRAAVADDHQPVDAARCSTSCAPSFPKFRHVIYDTMSLAALREANRRCHGAAVVPHYRFDRARVVVALEADFLGTWLAPVEFARQWARRRHGRRARPRASTSSAKPACRSRAATPTCASPSRRRSSARSRSRCWPPSAVASATRAWSAPAVAGLGRVARHAAAIERTAEALVRSRGESLVVSRQRRRGRRRSWWRS